jgi:hypothetical protein
MVDHRRNIRNSHNRQNTTKTSQQQRQLHLLMFSFHERPPLPALHSHKDGVEMEYCTQVACDTRPGSSRFRFCFENQQYATTTLTHAGYIILVTRPDLSSLDDPAYVNLVPYLASMIRLTMAKPTPVPRSFSVLRKNL